MDVDQYSGFNGRASRTCPSGPLIKHKKTIVRCNRFFFTPILLLFLSKNFENLQVYLYSLFILSKTKYPHIIKTILD